LEDGEVVGGGIDLAVMEDNRECGKLQWSGGRRPCAAGARRERMVMFFLF